MRRAETDTVTAAQVAVAIVSAAKIMGVDPAKVFEPGAVNTRARMLAGAGLCARLGAAKKAVAKLIRLPAPTLSPSLLAREKITTDQMLEVAEALAAAGLMAVRPERARAEAARSSASPRAAAASTDASSRKAETPASACELADAAVAEARTERALAAPPVARDARRQPNKTPAPKGEALRRIPGLKAVSDDIARWSGYFLDAGWRLPTVADLFEVCPVALLDVLDPVEARA